MKGSNSSNTNEFKSEMKKEIEKNILFPQIHSTIENIDLFQLPKPLLDISLFQPFQNGLNLNNPSTNNIVNLLTDDIFLISFNPTTEFISKSYNIYSAKKINKIYFLSNLYKIFMINIPTNIPFSSFDFFSTIILLCPDFPKVMIKKLDLLYQNFTNANTTPEIFNQNIELKTRVNMNEFFLMFSVYFLYNDFFNDIDKHYLGINSSTSTIRDLRKIKGLKKEYYYGSIIMCNKKLKDDYNLNTVNTIEDVEDIFDKNNEIKINYTSLCEKILKNKSLISFIFSIDERIKSFQYINSKC